jgi:hypothetical protein
MTEVRVEELPEKWKERVGRHLDHELDQEVEHAEDGMVSSTLHCLTCGEVVLRIDQPNLREPLSRVAGTDLL